MADGTKLALYCCFGLAALGAGSHTWLTREREPEAIAHAIAVVETSSTPP